jgi:hypothetical protein
VSASVVATLGFMPSGSRPFGSPHGDTPSRYPPPMDVGLVELLVFVVPMWAVLGFVVYWIIRLAVRHGTLDAYRIDRTDQRIAAMKNDLRRREAASGEVDRA